MSGCLMRWAAPTTCGHAAFESGAMPSINDADVELSESRLRQLNSHRTRHYRQDRAEASAGGTGGRQILRQLPQDIALLTACHGIRGCRSAWACFVWSSATAARNVFSIRRGSPGDRGGGARLSGASSRRNGEGPRGTRLSRLETLQESDAVRDVGSRPLLEAYVHPL